MNRVKLFKAYQKVYRYIENIRGANFLYRNLESMARKQVPEIEEDKTLSISEFEWSNLILLDACRYDVYREVVVRDVDFRITEGSHSEDFISSNFGEDEDWSDVVVVTANPHYENNIAEGGAFQDLLGKNAEEIFHEIYRAYRTDWSDKHSTVLPKDMVKLVKTVKALYPEKRLLIHFMQPHFPFINSDIGGGALFDGEYASPDDNIWSEARKGKYTKKEIWEAYRQNLKLAMEEVEGLVEVLNGKTVITADHGNLVGKYGLFGHPTGSNLRPLRKVPFDERD